MRITLFSLLLFLSLQSIAQKNTNYNFGKITTEEVALKKYHKDTTANALVLYEEGNNYFELVGDYIRLITKKYYKIKLFNKKAFDLANISIPLYIGENSSEKVKDIKALTHTKGKRIHLQKKDIYTKKIHPNWKETTFTLPNIDENCIIEYEYTIVSPFYYNLTGWNFQSKIPKLKSLFTAKIPGNYKYNRKLVGNLKLETNDASLERKCLYIPGFTKPADCEVLKYGMEHIPAFIEEDYMLASKNYIASINFELSEFMDFNGHKTRYSKRWKDVDKEFKIDKNIGKQSKKVSFFKDQLSADILNSSSSLQKAKKVYSFIQDHFTNNNNYGIFKNSRVKKAFENKIGSVSEINLSLLNALKAAGLQAHFVLLSTRNNGLPTTEYPIITDFNYLIVKLELGDQSYLLDASNKFIPFGVLPSKCLNYIGRVMDFDKGSYWMDITPYLKNSNSIISKITIDEESSISAEIKSINTGYFAINKIRNIKRNSKEEYFQYIKNDKNEISLDTYSYESEIQNKHSTNELFNVTFEEQDEDYIVINPFLIEVFDKNPFTLQERNYPVDFAYPIKQNYLTSIEIPETHELIEGIENQTYVLSENSGNISLSFQQKDNKVNISLRFSINKYHFKPSQYEELKGFFNKLVTIQNANPIVIKRKS